MTSEGQTPPACDKFHLIRRALATLALALLVPLAPRCARPGPAPERPPVQVPRGCFEDQSGEYVHAGDPAYRYRGLDDGGTLVLWLDQGPPGERDPRTVPADTPRVVLERTPHGFAGRTEAHAFTASGQRCAVTFSTQVVACPSEGLTLRTASSAAVDDLCRAPAESPGAAFQEHRLLRQSSVRDGGRR